MNEIISVVSKVTYIVFIVSSVFFGMSLAVRTLLVKTLKNAISESNKNFDKIGDIDKKSKSLEVIEKAKLKYRNYQFEAREFRRKNRAKNFANAFKKQKGEDSVKPLEYKEIFLSLYRETATVYSGEKSYLSFSPSEMLGVVNAIVDRLETILKSSKIIWLKSINVSLLLYGLDAYKRLETFKGKKLVFVTLYLIDIALKVSKIFSPIGAGNRLLTQALDGGISTLISTAVIEILGKEISSVYYEKSKDKLNLSLKTA